MDIPENRRKNKELLKLDFADMWKDFNKTNNFFYDLLSERYEIQISNKPDLLIFSCFGFNHLSYDCARLFYTGENRKANFNACDYAITFENLSSKKQYQLPHYVIRVLESGRLNDLERIWSREEAVKILDGKKKFCCTVVSNSQGTVRNSFFNELNSFKKVNSGGRFQNNVGGPVVNKNAFCNEHKFVFAFENEKEIGYCTEKITDAFLSNAIPIYYGDPDVSKIFNKDRFINYDDYPSAQALIDRIIEIDSNDQMFVDLLTKPIFKDGVTPAFFWKSNLLDFIEYSIEDSRNTKTFLQILKKYKYWLEIKVKIGVGGRIKRIFNKIK